MSLLTKALMIAAFFALIIALIFQLPLVADHPLDPSFSIAITTIYGYYFVWSQVFTALNYVFLLALLSLNLELLIVAWRFIAWILGSLAARITG